MASSGWLPMGWQELRLPRSPGVGEAGRRQGEPTPSPGTAQPGRDAKPRPWPTGVGKRRPTRRGGGSALLGCRGGLKDGKRKPATGGWRAGGRTRDARGSDSHQFKPVSHCQLSRTSLKTSKMTNAASTIHNNGSIINRPIQEMSFKSAVS